MTIMTFILAYVLPACFIVYTLLHSQLFMWNRRLKIHMICTKNAVTKMSHQLALTFNLTAALFMLIWTPFFILSIVDIQTGLINSNHHVNMNFTLRCTLLIFGSAKPLIYIICIAKFRRSLRCGFPPEDENTTRADPSSTVSRLKTTSVNQTISSPVTMLPLPAVSSA
ncbi:uncharacterized protein LOC128243969 [Mya arenaria]|uniref:uncharacterized protein LOC128243969 n=1 Tax=Mya arenaria TaxID=6604 RepID=UPI0022E42230|nr:uncharacterized protein LOC128243969 [Mya arenaria]